LVTPALVLGFLMVPAAAATSAGLSVTPAHGKPDQQFSVTYTATDADCSAAAMMVEVAWDGIHVAEQPVTQCATTITGLTPPAGPSGSPANLPGWHQLSAHLAMPNDQSPLADSYATTRYFVDPSGDAKLVLNPQQAHWYENFTLTYTVPTGFVCTQRFVEFRADGIGSAGTLLVRQNLSCPTTTNTASFYQMQAPATHTIWAYVIDASWQDVPGTEAYAQFTVEPGSPPSAPGGPAPPLSNTGGGGTSSNTVSGGTTGSSSGGAASSAQPDHTGTTAATAQTPAAVGGQIGDPSGVVASGSSRADLGPRQTPPPDTPLSFAVLTRAFAHLARPGAAEPLVMLALLLGVAGWAGLGALGATPAPLDVLRALAHQLKRH
jgi:hypothetical protein